ncbi:hypothetical protein D3C86_1994140 [compost metagenome]
MLVPLMVRRPPPGQADVMSTPGAASRAWILEKSATMNLLLWRPMAATEITSSAEAGSEVAMR